MFIGKRKIFTTLWILNPIISTYSFTIMISYLQANHKLHIPILYLYSADADEDGLPEGCRRAVQLRTQDEGMQQAYLGNQFERMLI